MTAPLRGTYESCCDCLVVRYLESLQQFSYRLSTLHQVGITILNFAMRDSRLDARPLPRSWALDYCTFRMLAEVLDPTAHEGHRQVRLAPSANAKTPC